MKVFVNQELFQKTLRRCILGGSLNPIHQGVRMEALKGKGELKDRLVFSSTAGQLAINTSIIARVEEPGITACNTKEIANAAGAMPSGEVAVNTTDKRISLLGSSGRKWSAATSDPTLIPGAPLPEKAQWLKVPSDALRAAIERVGYVTADVQDIADERSRDGVRIEAHDGQLTAIGCSGRMCVVFQQKAELEQKQRWEALIPTPAMNAINDVIQEAETEEQKVIELYTDERFIWAVGPATLFVASLPVGEFPPWRLLLQGFGKDNVCTVHRMALMESIKACQATGSAQASKQTVAAAKFKIAEGSVTLFREEKDSDFSDLIPLSDMQIGTNVMFKAALSYMLACLRGADEDPSFTFGQDGRMLLMRTVSGYRAAIALMDDVPEVTTK